MCQLQVILIMRLFKVSQSITDRKDASLGLYFKDVSQLSMIDAEEEVELANRIKKGDKQAENELIESNLRFVISVAKQYQNKGLDLVDLIQEGNCGLIESARKYDPTKGFKFISYAVWWIRQAIMKAITAQCRTVRVPMNHVNNMSKVTKATEKFEQEYGRKPTEEELLEYTDLDLDKIKESYVSTYRSISLETPIGDDSSCLKDLIPNKNPTTDANLELDDIKTKIRKYIKRLPLREQDILRMSFGIEVQQLHQEEIAHRFGIGNERVRQIQMNALKILRTRFGNPLSELIK